MSARSILVTLGLVACVPSLTGSTSCSHQDTGKEPVEVSEATTEAPEPEPDPDPVLEPDPEGRGYVSRGCGFDMDRDGIVGEPEDCFVCDASVVEGVVSGGTPDPDGDGTDEDLIYVDCDGGVDEAGCGQPGAPPCRTLQYAFDESDGRGDGAEEIFCFRGTCTPESLTPANGGIAGTYTVPASKSQTRAWEYPANPAMVVGWDTDADGVYPPFDPDDHALMDGGAPNDLDRAFVLNGATNDYLEMAHFKVRGYGNLAASGSDTGFMKPMETSWLYLHDIEANAINQDRCTDACPSGGSARSAFNMFGSDQMQYFAIVNSAFTNHGGYWMRGAGPYGASVAGPIRIESSTFTAHGADGAAHGTTFVKLWGKVTGFELLDSVIDGNVGAWDASYQGASGVAVAQCLRDADIINNAFTDLVTAVTIQGFAEGACDNGDARTVDDITVSWNDIQTHAETAAGNIYSGFLAFNLTGRGDSANETTEDITITDNTIGCSVDCQACLMNTSMFSGPSQPGVLTYERNICEMTDVMSPGDNGSLVILDLADAPRESYVIHDNDFTGLSSGQMAVNLHYDPTGWDADDNCYDPDATFRWNHGSETDFPTWQADSGGDANSFSQDPCPPIP